MGGLNTAWMLSNLQLPRSLQYVSRDDTKRIIHTYARKIGNLPVLMSKTLAIWNSLKRVNQERYSKAIIESDSRITIHAVNGKSKPPMRIYSLSEDIIMLA